MELLGEETLWEGKFIKMVLLTYRDRLGETRHWEAVGRMDASDVVVMVPVTAEGEVVLIKQYRPAVDSYVIELPAGLVDPGEDVVSAARRELIEETGHSARDILPLVDGVISTGINTETWNVFIALGAHEAPEDVRGNHAPDENEDIEVLKVPLEGAMEEILTYAGSDIKIDLRIFGLIELARKRYGKRTS